MRSDFCQLWLSCKDKAEADKVANALLLKSLVVCVKQVKAESDFRWQGKIENANEVLLEMLSRVDLFDKIEQEIGKLHSYDTFVLEATPILRVSKDAEKWLRSELQNG